MYLKKKRKKTVGVIQNAKVFKIYMHFVHQADCRHEFQSGLWTHHTCCRCVQRWLWSMWLKQLKMKLKTLPPTSVTLSTLVFLIGSLNMEPLPPHRGVIALFSRESLMGDERGRLGTGFKSIITFLYFHWLPGSADTWGSDEGIEWQWMGATCPHSEGLRATHQLPPVLHPRKATL